MQKTKVPSVVDRYKFLKEKTKKRVDGLASHVWGVYDTRTNKLIQVFKSLGQARWHIRMARVRGGARYWDFVMMPLVTAVKGDSND